MSHTGHFLIHAIALSPIHHGGGNKGNTSPIMRLPVVLEDASIDYVPVISGNSTRHMIRAAAVRYALATMGIPENSLSKGVVNLLFSGGSLGGKTAVTLAKAKRIAELFPALAVLGYSSGDEIMGGRLEVGYLHLMCEQNLYLQPATLAELPHWKRRASHYVDTQFSTRHDAANDAHASRYLLDAPPAEGAVEKKPAKKSKVPATTDGEPKREKDTQMIYDREIILPGSHMFARVVYRGLKDAELQALVSALEYACDGMHTDGGGLYQVGARSAVGLGTMSWHFSGFKREIATPSLTPDASALPAVTKGDEGERLRAYREHLTTRRDEIMRELEALAS